MGRPVRSVLQEMERPAQTVPAGLSP